jgi:4-hydroxybenzoyl-CoA reductase subunit alpha
LEPQVTVADFEPAGKLAVWTSSQGPFIKRAKLAKLLKLPFSAVRIQKAYVGGAFGGKIDLFSHEFCAAKLSMLAGLPVKIEASRLEIFSAYRHGQPLIVEVKTGVKKDGSILTIRYGRLSAGTARRRSDLPLIRSWT